MNRIKKPSLFILILMVSLGPFGDTIYAPALPEIEKLLHTDYAYVQLTITSYLLGYAVSQLLYGPFSDRYGRKKVILVGSLFFIISSVICLYSHSIDTLIYGRLLQGFGAAAGGVIATVAVKDAFEIEKQGSIFAIMNIAFALAPAIGAIIGVFIQAHVIFLVLLGAALFLFMKVLLFFPETNRNLNKDALKTKHFVRNYLVLFKDHQFVVATLLLGLNISIIYGCLVEIPDILLNKLHLDKIKFLHFLILIVSAVIIGSLICARLSKSVPYKNLITTGMLISLLSGFLCSIIFKYLDGMWLMFGLTFVLSLTFVGVSFTVPLLTPIALENFNATAGAASSIMGFSQMGIASLTTAIMSQLTFGTETTLSLAFIILPLIGLLIFIPYSCYFLKK
ncbi:multidrug effflux MFS transporter [Francisella frigiditurris]|uniref:Bcr/CflA family efflux transporter n=1 Tax=Francisella frigiditurris TaxID=1542390 RepID=A0A1J0KTT2_9GAMM|nr:multidrug effflux MFS transporter [Francisella frigiditurris]APC97044.1 drug resistance transporter, Bcr/CflA subfamily protein [Francisella frigiditurris]